MGRKVKINHDYFSLSNKQQNLSYFLRQGNVMSHLLDRFKWHYLPRHFITPAFPTHLDVETSSACQMRCPMCKTTEMVKKGVNFFGFMEMGLYKRIIDECAREPLYSVKLSWRGEPLLNPHIVDMVSYAKKSRIKDVAFLTNGERLNKKLTEQLLEAGLDWLSVSFDGIGEVYNNIRRPAVFKETKEKIRYIRLCRERLKKRKPLIRVQSIRSSIRGQESEFSKLWEGIADRVNFIADQKRSLDERDYRYDLSYICPSPWQRMAISWDGKVVQCCSDYMEGNVLGNVRENRLKEIWHGEPFRDLRELMKNGKRLDTKPCRTCSDGGITEREEILLGNRKVKALRYVQLSSLPD